MKKHVKKYLKFAGILLLTGVVLGFISGFVSVFVSPGTLEEVNKFLLIVQGFVGGVLATKWGEKE